MARFSGAAVLLILVATVSVYTCAILAGAALGRALDRPRPTKQPPADSTLQVSVSVSVSFRDLAEDFAKELWGGNHREGRRSGGGAHAGAGDRSAAAADLPSTAARASLGVTQAELEYHRCQHMVAQRAATRSRRETSRRDDVYEGGAAAALPSSAAGASIPLSPAELQYRLRQAMPRQIAKDTPREVSGSDDVHEGAAATTTRSLSRRSNVSDEMTEGTRPGGVAKVGPWGGSGGEAFYMRGGGGGGASAPRLLRVTLYHADAVHAFSFEYLLAGVRRKAYYGSKKLLRATATMGSEIKFSPDEQLTAVEGTFGRCRSVPEVVVTSLTFRTDKGRTYGPYGEQTGTPFSIPAANGCIVGFWGRSGWLLDAIGVYIMPCQVNVPTFFVSNAYKETS